MNYVQLYQAIQDYAESSEQLFVDNISTFVRQAEQRIYNTVQIPALRKNVTGNLSTGNQYLSLPNDYLSTYSLAVIDATNTYNYLLNKDVNFLREAYPTVVYSGTAYQGTPGGVPRYYALFGSQYSNTNELSLIVAPTPDSNYTVELHYFYYPVSIVQGAISTGTITSGSGYVNGLYSNVPLTGGSGSGATANITVFGNAVTSVTLNNPGNFYVVGDVLSASTAYLGGSGSGFLFTLLTTNNALGTSWLGDNYDPCLLYGSLREAVLFQKGEQDMVSYYEKQFQEAMQQLNRLGTGLERGDAYRDGQAKIKVNP
jgi:hypothetical protein